MWWQQALRFSKADHGLALVSGREHLALAETGEGTYGLPQFGLRFGFLDESPRRIERLSRSAPPLALLAAPPWTPDAAELDSYTGTWYSEELQARWITARDGDALVVRDLRATPRRWTPALPQVFTTGPTVLKFVVKDGAPAEILVGAGRARGMRFVRE